MANAETPPAPPDGAEKTAPVKATPLPVVVMEETAQEEKFECPQPWYLAVVTVAMSMMTSITVAGSLFFLLAAPEKVSPHCYERDFWAQGFCTASALAFWTYPVVCCLFVVLVYAKNLVDQRTYYEFLLHKVVIGYGRNPPYQNPTVLMLLIYACFAMSNLVWHHFSVTAVLVSHVFSSLAYIAPIVSFLAVIFTQWSIQGKLITLPNFLEDYGWAVKHLNGCRSYPVEDLHAGYLLLEDALEKSDEIVDTARVVALVEHYTQKVQNSRPPTPRSDDGEAVEAGAAKNGETLVGEAEAGLHRAAEEAKEYVYWEVRMLFNPRLQDERAHSFRNWALAYMLTVIFAIMLSLHIFVCCLITCLEIERVLVPGNPAFPYTHYFSLRPDLGAPSQHKSLKQVAASVALSAIQTGSRSLYNRVSPAGLLHFHIGAAA